MITPKKHQELRAKGWTETEVQRVENILNHVRKEDLKTSHFVFWSVLFLIILANVIVSLVLIPFLSMKLTWEIYLPLIVLGAFVGFLYNYLINDIRHLEIHHHFIGGLVLLIIGVINLVLISLVSDRYLKQTTLNPWLAGLIFAGAFILPYLLDRIRRKVKKR